MTGATRGSLGLIAVAAALLVATTACSSGDTTGSKRTTTIATTTSVPTPSTVSNADFDKQAATAELMIRNAGTEACAVLKAVPTSSNLPTPVNPTQVERGVKVVAAMFDAIASSEPPDRAADAAVLKKAAADLVAEGEANRWQPKWLMSSPQSIKGADVLKAFSEYQSSVTASCLSQTSTPTTAKP